MALNPLPHAYTDNQLVERLAIGLFTGLGWETVSALEEIFGAHSLRLSATLSHPMGEGAPLGRERKGEVVLMSRLHATLNRLSPTLSANGAVSSQPGATPQDRIARTTRAESAIQFPACSKKDSTEVRQFKPRKIRKTRKWSYLA